ncbi:MFS transporter [Thermobispora bispora]|jgi:MFS transporter, DHA2 family, multidrug resistance protein|uniref:Major facilitator superfamily MFS_1 n=1 Tax=Thermobispora bispora (strain ATCC 19993 / DSM 43833 / CBS 139.67 / JCM 10125 / KCTC 9307 / NBRC 14880 / R51) TaxID=469371 RepID=D6Y406_THEBD|nr:MFS transporter [Thermobispora bispora]ADG89108.1 major facilitator superfamily MFS_1 [Thermobispora bispora DSM 43833]MBO2474336.1 MFS transporter [Actinomycetales bacterium]QSI48825.1 MFS transporter [Thermobispora bispora]
MTATDVGAGPAAARHPAGAVDGRRRWSILALLCCSLLLIAVDATVLHIAVPALTAALKPSAVELLWIIDVYSLVVAPLLITFGTLGDRFGRRRLLLSGYAVFGLASLAAAFAPSPPALIAARAALGVGGAMIMPATLSIIRQVFTDRRERALALGVWSAVAAAGAAMGPLIGGVLVEHLWWGAVFLINVPLLLAALPVAAWLLPASPRRPEAPWDWPSAALSIVGILAIAFGVKEGGDGPAAGRWIAGAMLLAGVALLAWFVRRQRRLTAPLLDIGLFTRRAFATGVACVLLAVFSLVGLELLLAQYLQLVLGLTPVGAALRMLPLMLAAVTGGILAAFVLRWLGLRATIAGGLALTAVSLVPTLFWGTEPHETMLAVCLMGIGFGVEVALLAASDTIMASAPEERAGGAAAIEETAYELGAGLGIAVLGTITTIGYASALRPVAGVPAGLMARARESLAAAADVAAGVGGPAGAALLGAAKRAFVSALHHTVTVSVALLAGTALMVALLLPRSAQEPAGEGAPEGQE